MTKTTRDDGLEWLHEIRRKSFAACDHDPALLVDRYRAAQARHANQVVQPLPRVPRAAKLAA